MDCEPDRAELRINVVDCSLTSRGPDKAGPRLNIVDCSVACGPEKAGPRIHVVDCFRDHHVQTITTILFVSTTFIFLLCSPSNNTLYSYGLIIRRRTLI